MKIKRFIGKKVRGYMDFDITFNDGLNFIIGINGTGKTTILNLLKGLLMPHKKTLKDIDYQEIKLDCEFDGQIVNISSTKGENIGSLKSQKVSFLELDRVNRGALIEINNFFLTKDIDSSLDFVNRFVNGVKVFFSEGNKTIEVDAVNRRLIVKIEGKEITNTIFDLSSGEQQLIVMLWHLAFDNSDVYVIDEPELSLHLSWQYKFAEALQAANPNAQFIMATHSPAIIAKKLNEDLCIDLTPKRK